MASNRRPHRFKRRAIAFGILACGFPFVLLLAIACAIAKETVDLARQVGEIWRQTSAA